MFYQVIENKNSKKWEQLKAAASRYSGGSIWAAYDRPSFRKIGIYETLKNEMNDLNGYNFKICSYCINNFTASFEDDLYIYYFTKSNSFKILK